MRSSPGFRWMVVLCRECSPASLQFLCHSQEGAHVQPTQSFFKILIEFTHSHGHEVFTPLYNNVQECIQSYSQRILSEAVHEHHVAHIWIEARRWETLRVPAAKRKPPYGTEASISRARHPLKSIDLSGLAQLVGLSMISSAADDHSFSLLSVGRFQAFGAFKP